MKYLPTNIWGLLLSTHYPKLCSCLPKNWNPRKKHAIYRNSTSKLFLNAKKTSNYYHDQGHKMFREPTDQQRNVSVLEDRTGSCLTWTRCWFVSEHAICLGNISGNVLFFESWDSTADKTEFLSRISKVQSALLWVTQFKNRTERGALDLVFLV